MGRFFKKLAEMHRFPMVEWPKDSGNMVLDEYCEYCGEKSRRKMPPCSKVAENERGFPDDLAWKPSEEGHCAHCGVDPSKDQTHFWKGEFRCPSLRCERCGKKKVWNGTNRICSDMACITKHMKGEKPDSPPLLSENGRVND